MTQALTTLDEHYMRLALEQAQQAFTRGDVPVGAVIVKDGHVISQGYNTRELEQDPTAHAEMAAIRSASAQLGTWRLNDTTLYVTLEPCAMCAGALVQARIGRVVFGASDPKSRAYGSLADFLNEPHFNHLVEVQGGVLANECSAILQSFFQQLRDDHATNSDS
ncbi:MAG: tRNA-specific adenosine deaminase [Nitrospirales bacterium]|nr:MAG: tRNA-specific adenosine deaminase [Nitrospirales bacterium]